MAADQASADKIAVYARRENHARFARTPSTSAGGIDRESQGNRTN